MSTNLYYHVHKNALVKTKDNSLKNALRNRYGNPLKDVVLTDNHRQWINGLIDAGITDAERLLNLISRHGEVVIDELS